jgi:polar amino acid transport system substrate-binding protein
LASQNVTIYGDKSYPPYSYFENGEAKGIYVDIIRRVFDDLPDYNVTFEMVPWKRSIDGVKSGEFAAFFTPYFSEKRTSWVSYSEAILQEQVIVFGQKENMKGKVKWPEYFYYSTIGLNNGFGVEVMGGKDFVQAVDDGHIKIKHTGDSTANLKKLDAQRIDFYLNDKLTDISNYSSVSRGIVIKDNSGYLGFTKKAEAFPFLSDLFGKFNMAMKELKAEGAVQEIVNTYIK